MPMTSEGSEAIEPPRGSEIERFSHSLETVYDCVLEPENWTAALREINGLTGADSSAFHWGDVVTQTVIEAYHVGMTPEFLEALRRHSIAWAMQVNAIGWEVGKVQYLADLLDRNEFENGRFYREVILPHRQCDYMAVNPVNNGRQLASLSVNTNINTGLFQPRSVELMRLLAPHICKAARLSAAFDLKTMQASMLEKTLDTLASGVILLNAQGQVVYSNASAQHMLQGHGGIGLANGRLVIKNSEAESSFTSSLAAMRDPAPTKRQPHDTIAIPDDLNPLILTFLSIATGRRKGLMGNFEATVAIFIQHMGRTSMIPGKALGALYDLTPTEIKVTMALLQGFGVADTADILGIAEATVRSHLKHIYSKTGATRQAELIQMLMRAMSPVAD